MSDCWTWIKTVDGSGYGQCAKSFGERRAHRVAYGFVHGPAPADFHVHHECRNTSCVNPDHLRALSPSAHIRADTRFSRSPFTADEVATIRARSLAGEDDTTIAEDYGVHRTTIGRLVRRQRWEETSGASLEDRQGLKTCPECGGEDYSAVRRHAKFCSPKCRILFNGRINSRRHYWREKGLRDAA